jgi:hypothetical protein
MLTSFRTVMACGAILVVIQSTGLAEKVDVHLLTDPPPVEAAAVTPPPVITQTPVDIHVFENMLQGYRGATGQKKRELGQRFSDYRFPETEIPKAVFDAIKGTAKDLPPHLTSLASLDVWANFIRSKRKEPRTPDQRYQLEDLIRYLVDDIAKSQLEKKIETTQSEGLSHLRDALFEGYRDLKLDPNRSILDDEAVNLLELGALLGDKRAVSVATNLVNDYKKSEQIPEVVLSDRMDAIRAVNLYFSSHFGEIEKRDEVVASLRHAGWGERMIKVDLGGKGGPVGYETYTYFTKWDPDYNPFPAMHVRFK